MITLEKSASSYKYIQVRSIELDQVRESRRSCLYIGHDRDCQAGVDEMFATSMAVESLDEAMKVLKSQDKASAIIIDLPFNAVTFYMFLSEKERMADWKDVPVIMNFSRFDREEVSMIRRKKMADELVDLREDFSALPEKIEFLSFLRKRLNEKRNDIRVEYKRSAVQSEFSQVRRFISMFLP